MVAHFGRTSPNTSLRSNSSSPITALCLSCSLPSTVSVSQPASAASHSRRIASRDADGQWYIHGRSDDTMKIAGKRTGPAEIEALLMATGQLAESAAVAVPDQCLTRSRARPS